MENPGNLARRMQMTTGGPCWVYVDEEENKIVRVVPIDLTDEADKYRRQPGLIPL